MLSMSRDSLRATSRGTIGDALRVTAKARRTSSVASCAITRQISAARARSSPVGSLRSTTRQSLWAAIARSSGVAPFTSIRTSSSVSAALVVDMPASIDPKGSAPIA